MSAQTLVLNGDESICFARSVFMPTSEEIDLFDHYWTQINNSITISETANGFEADIPDLDLHIDDNEKSSVNALEEVKK